MKLTILGYYGGFPTDGVGTTGYLLQSEGFNLLLDAGSGTLLELEKHLDPLQLDAVLLTHYHHDHTADVGVLQYLWQLKQGSKKQDILPIYGHFQDPLNFGALSWPDSTIGKAYSTDTELNLGPFKITFCKTVHPVPAFAVRIQEKSTGKIFSFTSDTTYFDGLVNFVKDSDLLITDTNFLSDKEGTRWHLTTKETAQLFDDSKSRKLIISHLPTQINLEKLLDETKKFSRRESLIQLPELGKEYLV